MAFTRIAALLHSALSDVSTAQHHTATVAGDLNLADLANRAHSDLTGIVFDDHNVTLSQANLEAESTTIGLLKASNVRFAPGVAKLRAHITISGALSAGSYNVASVTDTGTGDRTVVIDDDFSVDTYQPGAQLLEENIAGGQSQAYIDVLAVGSFRHRIYDEGVALQDQVSCVWAFGDQ